jgi:hypothetical protein
MARPPGHLTLERNRDLMRRGSEVWARRALLLVFLAVPVAGLLNVFGQEPSSARTVAPAASLSVTSPTRIRGGLLYEARLEVRANRTIAQPKLVLDRGWFESLTINTKAPEPVQEATQGGLVVYTYDRLERGSLLIVWMQFQVNPTNWGSQSQDVALYDGRTRLTALSRSVFIFP